MNLLPYLVAFFDDWDRDQYIQLAILITLILTLVVGEVANRRNFRRSIRFTDIKFFGDPALPYQHSSIDIFYFNSSRRNIKDLQISRVRAFKELKWEYQSSRHSLEEGDENQSSIFFREQVVAQSDIFFVEMRDSVHKKYRCYLLKGKVAHEWIATIRSFHKKKYWVTLQQN